MRSVGAQIRKLARGLGFESSLKLSSIQARWDELIGPPVSIHSWPVFLEKGPLTLTVESPAWLQQLGFYTEDLRSKLSGNDVTGIKLRLGNIPEREIKVHGEISGSNIAEVTVPEGAKRFIKEESEQVSDPELREQIVRAMEAWAAGSRGSRGHRRATP